MTTKEIAEAVGKKERGVHNWVKMVSAKNAKVSAKIAEARETSKAADYDLEETCQIIEEGIGKNAADLFRMGAKNNVKVVPQNVTDVPQNVAGFDKLAESILSMVSAVTRLCDRQESQEGRLSILEKKPLQIDFTPDRYSILGYCNFKKIQITYSEAIQYGRKAAKITREKGFEVRKIADERHGTVGSYPIEILNDIFEL